jgi:DNA-3-methyladenine glycosylase II
MSEIAIAHLSNVDAVMAAVIRTVGVCALQSDAQCAPFQSLAEAITHQQLNGTAARTILNRFILACGKGAFPTPDNVLAAPAATLRAAGLSFAKIAALKDLAAKTLEGVVPDHPTLLELADADIIARLTQVRGIGRWTVEMMLMFRLGRPDILPVDDFGVRAGFQLAYGLKKMPAPAMLAIFGERWAPHRTVAAWYLWRAVELGRAGKLPAPVEVTRLPRLRRRKRVAKRKTAKDSSPRKAKRGAATVRKVRATARAKIVAPVRKARPKRARK